MSLAVAVPCAVLGAVAYGASSAVQQSAAHTATGRSDARGLLALLRNPRWLLSIGGDTLGLLLQVVALATGPVVVVQPLLVLAVPVALLIGRLLGGPRPRRSDYLACAAIGLGLGVFFLIVGDPGRGRPLTTAAAATTTGAAVVIGSASCLAVTRCSATVRAATYGTVAGAWFGLVGVLLNATATRWQNDGLRGLAHAPGWVPATGVVAVGALALTLTQIAFQVGALAASFPASEAAAPVLAVALGASLLHEQVPLSAPALAAYVGCVGCVLAGAIHLARSHAGKAHVPT